MKWNHLRLVILVLVIFFAGVNIWWMIPRECEIFTEFSPEPEHRRAVESVLGDREGACAFMLSIIPRDQNGTRIFFSLNATYAKGADNYRSFTINGQRILVGSTQGNLKNVRAFR
jgi:hypothetical protein